MKTETPDELSNLIQEIHHTSEDFSEGNLIDRIWKFKIYHLIDLDISKIDLDEFYIDEDRVEKYISMILSNKECPPIVYDDDEQSIIDGIHRANAYHQAGLETIKAWIGLTENIDPSWTDDY